MRVVGLSVLQRTIFALERAGVHSITLIARSAADPSLTAPLTRARKTRVHWCAPGELPERVEGETLLLLRPVVLNSKAIDALSKLGDSANPVIALHASDRSGKFIATGAYLVAGAVADTMRRLLDENVAPNTRPTNSDYPCVRLPAGLFYPLGSDSGPSEIRAAEKMLLGSLRKNTDGFFAYWFDRRISTAISRVLVLTRVTPNQISIFTLIPALAGAALVAAPGRLLSGLGAILYLISTILDGCDGEVARLKYLESAKGARLDLACDIIGLVALFLGIIVHVHSEVGGTSMMYVGGAAIGGLVAAQAIEYLLITRPRIRSGEGNGPVSPNELKRRELYERLASRDFAYLLPVLAFTGTLSLFVWATAVGVNLFWVALVVIVARKPTMNQFRETTTELRS
jgi:phosphatidylglycerophosphate synthase